SHQTLVHRLVLVFFVLYVSSNLCHGEQACRVYVTVSSFWFLSNEAPHGLQSRHLELNWEPAACLQRRLHSVALLARDPAITGRWSNDSWVLSHLLSSQHPEGYFRTTVSLGKPRLPGDFDSGGHKHYLHIGHQNTTRPKSGDHCLPYWAAAYDGSGALIASDCLRIRPTWMWDHRTQLGGARLSQLMLPGTHNSGCFYGGEEALTRADTVARFVFTQDEDVWEQLVWGARYIDIRVGYYRDKAVRLWVNHGPVKVTALQPILRDVRRFLLLSPGEVVILDFHRFPVGFSKSWQRSTVRHRRLATMIRDELGDLAAKCTPNGSPRLNDLWSNDKRLVVMHAERGEVHVNWDADWLCGPLTQAWGNQHSTAGLKQYLQEAVKRYSGGPAMWAAMAELTPSPLDPVLRPSRGLRLMADDVNRHVTRWFRELWWRDANVVATDYLLGNKIVDVAIEANLRRRTSN
ncbi:hypothetical protein B566_EDAN002637, partial [Ephemera danica]